MIEGMGNRHYHVEGKRIIAPQSREVRAGKAQSAKEFYTALMEMVKSTNADALQYGWVTDTATAFTAVKANYANKVEKWRFLINIKEKLGFKGRTETLEKEAEAKEALLENYGEIYKNTKEKFQKPDLPEEEKAFLETRLQSIETARKRMEKPSK